MALITLNPEELSSSRASRGSWHADPSALAKHPKVVERVPRTVDEKNSELAVLRQDQEVRHPARGLHAGDRRADADPQGQAQGHHRAVPRGRSMPSTSEPGPRPLRLDGRVAIVTGASRGLGRAMALALAEAGADVAVAARSEARARGDRAATSRSSAGAPSSFPPT